MKAQFILFTLIFSLAIPPQVLAESLVKVSYGKTHSAVEAKIQTELKNSTVAEYVASIINENFKLTTSIKILFAGNDGPLFDPQTNEIIVPYAFLEEIKQRFTNDNYAETGVSVKDATLDALTHTLFHEIGHALIAMYDLPIVGKEEDAADALANILLIEFFQQGQEIARSAADLFDIESNDIKTFEEADFWDEHSLDAQRFYTTLCHIYGSDPKNYADIPIDYQFSEDRSELCITEYNNLAHSWFQLLAPYTIK